MRIGRWIITREHPDEKALRKWGELTPELRELVARAARSIAKDAVQDVMDEQGLVYDPSRSSYLPTTPMDGFELHGTVPPPSNALAVSAFPRHEATEIIPAVEDE
jgi:hypothetical protein